MKKILLLTQLWLASVGYILAHEGEKPHKDTKPSSAKVESGQPYRAVSQQLQQRLDNAVMEYERVQNFKPYIAPDHMLDLREEVSEQTEDDRSTARKLMTFLDNNADRVKEDVNFEDLTVLPVGIRKKLGDRSVLTLGILRAEFKATYAEVTVFIRLTTQVNSSNSTIKERDLFFGVEGLRFTKQAGLSAANFKAVLLGDYLLPYKDWTVKLKGGLDKSVTPSESDNERCYVKMNCGSFEELNVAADIVIPRSKLLPCTAAGDVIQDPSVRVTATGLQFKTTKGLRDVVFQTGVITPFAIPSNTEYVFKVSNLAFDLSDFANPSVLDAAGFPAGYVGDMDAKWQGLYVGAFSIMLPSEFEDKDNPNTRVSINGEKIYWDRTGFSGFVGVSGLNKKINAKRWTLGLDYFKLGFLQNKFIAGEFGGYIETPVNKENEDRSKLLSLSASIFMDTEVEPGKIRSNYRITVITERDMPLNMWFAKAQIAPGSLIELSLTREVDNSNTTYRFKPRAILSGNMQIGAKKDGDEVGDHQTGQTIELSEIEFTKLVIQTEAPYVSVESFKYNKGENNIFANFPVQLTKFEKYTGQLGGVSAGNNDLWTEVGLNIDLFKGKFTGQTSFVVKSIYDSNSGKIKPKGIAIRRVYVKGDITPVTVEGFVDVKEDENRKEISGMLNVTVTKPKEFTAQLAVLFGRDKVASYKYGYVDGYALFGNGINCGAFNIYGAGLGVYWNMKPEPLSSPPSGPSCTTIAGTDQVMRYCPTQSIPLGIRMMAAIKNPGGSLSGKTLFKIRAYLDFSLNSNYGINNIALYGNGVIAGDFLGAGGLPADDKNAQLAYARNVSAKVDPTQSSIKNGDNNQTQNKAKAAQLNAALNSGGRTAPPEGFGIISFTAGIMVDIPNKVFHAEAEVFLKQNELSGIGPFDRVGKAEIHFDENLKYIHVGRAAKPDRIGVKYSNLARIDAYLMIGDGVPQFPAPDREVLAFFPSLRNRFSGPVCSDVRTGKAFALGASARVDMYGSALGFYIKGTAMAGFDVLVSNNAPCITPGSWLGQGQFYGLLKAEAGFKGIQLASLGLGVYAYIQAPKPFGIDAEACVAVPRWLDRDRVKCLGVGFGQNCNATPRTCGTN